MSGHVDSDWKAAAVRASADAAKRGLRIVAMESRRDGQGRRTFLFGYEPIDRPRRRRANPGPTPVQTGVNPISPPKVARGVRPIQEKLL